MYLLLYTIILFLHVFIQFYTVIPLLRVIYLTLHNYSFVAHVNLSLSFIMLRVKFCNKNNLYTS
jgi:hypothetical protein